MGPPVTENPAVGDTELWAFYNTPSDTARPSRMTGARGPATIAGAQLAFSVETYNPNHRCRLAKANASFSAASSREGPTSRAVGVAPPKKLASTLPTMPPPNSM